MRVPRGGQVKNDLDRHKRVHQMVDHMNPHARRNYKYAEGPQSDGNGVYKGKTQPHVPRLCQAGRLNQDTHIPLREWPIQLKLDIANHPQDAVMGQQSTSSNGGLGNQVHLTCSSIALDNCVGHECAQTSV